MVTERVTPVCQDECYRSWHLLECVNDGCE